MPTSAPLHALCLLAATAVSVVVVVGWPRLARWLASPLGWVTRELRFLRVKVPARLVFGAALAASVLGLGALCFDWRVALGFWGGPVLGMGLVVRARRIRVERIEEQVEALLGALARSLEAAPSLGDALAEAARVLDAPLADELDETLRQLALGRSLEEALAALGCRVGSRRFSLALATIEVGRSTGGRLPRVLRSAAAALREMQRLEGVLRTKTAEGRAQAAVISIVPFPLYFGLRFMDPSYFLPLEHTMLGNVMLGVAVLLWLAALLLAQRILAVDL